MALDVLDEFLAEKRVENVERGRQIRGAARAEAAARRPRPSARVRAIHDERRKRTRQGARAWAEGLRHGGLRADEATRVECCCERGDLMIVESDGGTRPAFSAEPCDRPRVCPHCGELVAIRDAEAVVDELTGRDTDALVVEVVYSSRRDAVETKDALGQLARRVEGVTGGRVRLVPVAESDVTVLAVVEVERRVDREAVESAVVEALAVDEDEIELGWFRFCQVDAEDRYEGRLAGRERGDLVSWFRAVAADSFADPEVVARRERARKRGRNDRFSFGSFRAAKTEKDHEEIQRISDLGSREVRSDILCSPQESHEESGHGVSPQEESRPGDPPQEVSTSTVEVSTSAAGESRVTHPAPAAAERREVPAEDSARVEVSAELPRAVIVRERDEVKVLGERLGIAVRRVDVEAGRGWRIANVVDRGGVAGLSASRSPTRLLEDIARATVAGRISVATDTPAIVERRRRALDGIDEERRAAERARRMAA